jgi:hypothetical protein
MRSQIQESADAQSDARPACARLTRDRVRLAAGTYSLRLQPPPICGGFASAICRCWVRGWGSGRAHAKAGAPSSRPTPRHFSIQEKSGNAPHPNLTNPRLPNSLSPKHRGPTLASASGGRSLQCGSRRRCRYPEPNRLCDLACAAGGSVSAHSEASTETVPQRRPASCPPRPAARSAARERRRRGEGEARRER